MKRLLTLGALVLHCACASPTDEERDACTPIICAAGHCELVGGAPTCVCGARELALGVTCEVLSSTGDDFGAEVEGAARLTPGDAPLEARINQSDGRTDRDVFLLTTLPGRVYGVRWREVSLAKARLELLDEIGAVVDQPLAVEREGVLTFKGGSGSRLVRVSPLPDNAIGRYTLQLLDLGADDAGDTRAEAAPIAPGSYSGRCQFPNDVDWLALSAAARHVYQVVMVTTDQPINVQLRDAMGQALNPIDLIWRADEATTFYVEVTPWTRALSSYTLVLADLGEDDAPELPPSSRPVLANGVPISGFFEVPYDVDILGFDAVADHIYRTTGQNGFFGNLAPDGTALTSSFRAATSGRHFVRGWGPRGPYQVVVDDRGPDAHGDTAMDAFPLLFGVAVSGAVEPSADRDFFSFPALPDHAYRIEQSGTGGNRTLVLLVDPANGGIFSGKLLFKRGLSGLQPLEVKQDSTYPEPQYGDYTLRVDDLGADDHGDTPATATPLTLGATGTGRLETYDDRDCFAVELSAATRYTLTGTPNVPAVSFIRRIYDPAGTHIFAGFATQSFNTGAVAGTHALCVETLAQFQNPPTYEVGLR